MIKLSSHTPIKFSLEEALEYIQKDEYVEEVTQTPNDCEKSTSTKTSANVRKNKSLAIY